MRIQLNVSGGMAYIPGLSRPIIIDSDTLPPQEAEELRRLVDDAHFFDLPPVFNVPAPGAADYRQYTITVEDGKKHHTIQAVDPITDPHLQALLRFLQTHR